MMSRKKHVWFRFDDVVSSNLNNYDFVDRLIAAGWDQKRKVEANITIDGGVRVGSTSTGTNAMLIDDPGVDVDVYVIVNGRIQGRGGNGATGDGSSSCSNVEHGPAGSNGGPALRTLIPIKLENNGEIWSGGGGGGGGGYHQTQNEIDPYVGCEFFAGSGGGGGGGQGSNGGSGGLGGRNCCTASCFRADSGNSGSASSPGSGGTGDSNAGDGGAGGGPGQSGQSGEDANFVPRGCGGSAERATSGSAGGSPGAAINGDSLITYVATGDIRGSTIN